MKASSRRPAAAPPKKINPKVKAFRIRFGIAAMLVMLSLSSRATAQGLPSTPANEVQELTNEFLSLREQMLVAPAGERETLRAASVEVLQRRQRTLQLAMRKEPSGAVSVALPALVLSQVVSESPDSKPFLESHGVWRGKLDYFVIDEAGARTHRVVRRLDVGGRKFDLHFAGNEPPGLKNGDDLAVTGVLSGTDLAVTSSAGLSATSIEDSCAITTGQQNAAVLLVTFPGVTPPSEVTPQSMHEVFFNDSGQSVNSFWREASYGSTWLRGDVFGWHTLSGSYACSDLTRLRADAISAVSASGIDLRAYQRLFIVFPDSLGCGWSGLAMLGCSTLNSTSGSFNATTTFLTARWMAEREEAVRISSHEAGHNLGLGHAGARDHGSEVLGPLDVPGSFAEYGDPFSTMGCCDVAHYAAPHKAEILGWMTGRFTTVESSGTYFVAPFELSSAPTNALKIRRGASDAWVWVEYRQPVGFDAGLPSGAFGGVLVHYQDASSGSFSQLLDFTPSTTSWMDAAMAAGKSWTDPYTNLSISVLESGPLGASVNVAYGPAPCTRANPTVAITPSNPSGFPGSSIAYSISVKNNDAPACAPGGFALGSALPSGWSASFSASSLTLAPGETGSATLTASVPPDAAAGTYTVVVNATDGSYSANASAGCTVTLEPQLAVELNLSRNNLARRETVSIRAIVSRAGSPVAGATVSFTLVKPDGRRTVKTVITKGNGVASWDYRIALKDPLGVYSIYASAAAGSQVAVNSTVFMVQ